MDGMVATLLAGLLGIFGFGMDGNDQEQAVCPEKGVCAPHRPAPTAVCPDEGPCAPYRLPPR